MSIWLSDPLEGGSLIKSAGRDDKTGSGAVDPFSEPVASSSAERFFFFPWSLFAGYSHGRWAATHRKHVGRVSSHLTFCLRQPRQPVVLRENLTRRFELSP